MICFAFPLEHEAEEFVKAMEGREQFSIGRLRCTVGRMGGRTLLVALVGMGQDQARENIAKVFEYFRLKAVVLAGYGGALVPQLKVGQIVVSNNFSSEETLTFLRLLSGFDYAGFCTTSEVIGTPQLRDDYARQTHHQVAEMETATVAHFVRSRDIPFIALRVISDDYEQVLPQGALAAGFDAKEGKATPMRLLLHLAFHREEIKPFSKFVAGLGAARKRLTAFLQHLNDELPSGW